jgi:hypothetical protein
MSSLYDPDDLPRLARIGAAWPQNVGACRRLGCAAGAGSKSDGAKT